jgi:hypothetical protein
MKHLKKFNESIHEEHPGMREVEPGIWKPKGTLYQDPNEKLEKVVVYCRAYGAGDSYVGDKWFMTEEEAWDVKEGEPRVMRVETYISSNAHNAALKNERIR